MKKDRSSEDRFRSSQPHKEGLRRFFNREKATEHICKAGDKDRQEDEEIIREEGS